MADDGNILELDGVTKKYDGFTLENVSFSVPKGSIMGIIGQNGSGKTTIINSILNITKINDGKINIFGKDHIKNECDIKEDIAVVFDEVPFNDSFNAKHLNIMFGGLYKNWNKKCFFEYIERLGLPVKKKIGKFSKGMKMKMQIATALSHDAKLLIMDEATTGLDPVVRSEILDIFCEYLSDGERSIFMSSHITSDIERAADSLTFIDKGKILLSGYKDDILDSHAVIKCKKAEFEEISKDDYISARHNDYGAEILTSDKENAKLKYSGAVIEKTTLDEIMLFYVNREKKVWS
ncbi:MAG: ABC transporter ATP-binding protein [Clostridia bacterium]|nr:ABC transporter ATP-binding protein [Clostridia bacterium]